MDEEVMTAFDARNDEACLLERTNDIARLNRWQTGHAADGSGTEMLRSIV